MAWAEGRARGEARSGEQAASLENKPQLCLLLMGEGKDGPGGLSGRRSGRKGSLCPDCRGSWTPGSLSCRQRASPEAPEQAVRVTRGGLSDCWRQEAAQPAAGLRPGPSGQGAAAEGRGTSLLALLGWEDDRGAAAQASGGEAPASSR